MNPTNTVQDENIAGPDGQFPIAQVLECSSSNEYDRIHSQIKIFEHSIVLLKREHNGLSHPAKLPPELMLEIFQWLRYENERDLITATHVCYLWRHIALGCPRFWLEVDCGDLSRAQEYVLRAADSPLCLTVKGR